MMTPGPIMLMPSATNSTNGIAMKHYYKPRHGLHQLIEHGFIFPGRTEQDIRSLVGGGDETTLLETDGELLEPRAGDWLFSHKRGFFEFEAGSEQAKIDALRHCLFYGAKIVRRDGKAFFLPEVEA